MRFNYDNITVSTGGDLPHWNVPGGLYLTTFRLSDAVPLTTLQRLVAARDAAIRLAESQADREARTADSLTAYQTYQQGIESTLDENLGGCVLRDPTAASIVENALQYFDKERYDLFTWSVMPNHVHNVFRLGEQSRLYEVMHSWKSYTAKEINRALGTRGVVWQPDTST